MVKSLWNQKVKMNLFSLILATITLLIQEYADYDKEEDHNKTLLELKRDLNFPRIKSFDFIVGEWLFIDRYTQYSVVLSKQTFNACGTHKSWVKFYFTLPNTPTIMADCWL